MLTIDKQSNSYLYQQVTDLSATQIEAGVLRPGERLPSLRRLSQSLGLSVPTVKQGYLELERQGRIESRPQSGFYVRARMRNPSVGPVTGHGRISRPAPVACRPVMEAVFEGFTRPGIVPLGIANPSMAKPATKALHRAMKRVMTRAEDRTLGYAPQFGEPGLRRQIAFQYLEMGGNTRPDDVIITNGGQEAIAIALMTIAGAGDVIAVESPTYFGMLELIESLGMLAVEIETCPIDGVCLDSLATALQKHEIRACLFSSALNNPLGSLAGNEQREALVAMLEQHEIPLIEDDVYGDLLFSGAHPIPANFFSKKNLVLTCSSFSKTVAPGYRIGWLLPGRFAASAQRLKRAWSCSSGMLQQLTLCEYIGSGDYDRHLRALRPTLKQHCERMSALIADFFPPQTRVSQPRGGAVLWLELPGNMDALNLFEQALEEKISIAPGPIFSPLGRYRNYIRLSFGFPWSDEIEQGVQQLGRLICAAV